MLQKNEVRSRFEIIPESLISRILFGFIDSFSWTDYTLKIKFTGRKAQFGNGFECNGFKIEPVSAIKKSKDYKSQAEIFEQNKTDMLQKIKERARLAGKKGGKNSRGQAL